MRQNSPVTVLRTGNFYKEPRLLRDLRKDEH